MTKYLNVIGLSPSLIGVLYYFLHLTFPREVPHALPYFFRGQCIIGNIINNSRNIYWRFIRWGFENVGLVIEVTVVLGIYERHATGGVFPVL